MYCRICSWKRVFSAFLFIWLAHLLAVLFKEACLLLHVLQLVSSVQQQLKVLVQNAFDFVELVV